MRGALLPPAGVPPPEPPYLPHFTEGVRGAPAPSPWRGWQPGRAWVGRASPPVFLPDVQGRGAPSRPGHPQPRVSARDPHGLGPALGPLCLRAGPPHWLCHCLQGGRHSASQPRECAHRKPSAGHSARRKSRLSVGFCSFTDSGHKLPIYSIFNQSKSSLFSHKLRKAEMLMVTVGTARALLLCGGDSGPAAAPGGTTVKPCGSWGSTSQGLDAPPRGHVLPRSQDLSWGHRDGFCC